MGAIAADDIRMIVKARRSALESRAPPARGLPSTLAEWLVEHEPEMAAVLISDLHHRVREIEAYVAGTRRWMTGIRHNISPEDIDRTLPRECEA